MQFVPTATAKRSFALLLLTSASACPRTLPTDPPPPSASSPSSASSALAPVPVPAPVPGSASAPASGMASASASASSIAPAAPLPLSARTDGARELPLTADRAVYYARPLAPARGGPPWRLVAHLHGICHPPSYSAGKWLGAAVGAGVLVTPTGNARCGDPTLGPPSWEAPTWAELVTIMDADLERSIAKVEARHPGSIRRAGAVLTGYSRGAFAAPVIARSHPGRWAYLVLIEANVTLSAASLRKSGVRAVALLAGEWGTELPGERKTEAELVQAGFPARLFVMPRVGHQYPDDMDRIMGEALDFVLSHERDAGDAGDASDAGTR